MCSSGVAASCSRDEEDDVLRMTRELRAFCGASAFGTPPLLMDDAVPLRFCYTDTTNIRRRQSDFESLGKLHFAMHTAALFMP